jgi:uncharacterized OB-fold protein
MMSMPPVQRDDSSAAFFDAAAEATLLIKRCTKCRAYGPPRQTTCRRCGCDTAWAPASGDATLITWTATPLSGKAPDTAPITFGYVELAEGPWLETILVDVPADVLREGEPLHVTFLHHPDGETIPAFELAATIQAGATRHV